MLSSSRQPPDIGGFKRPSLFLPLIFLGTASGQFLRPAASRLLLSVPPHKAPARLGSSGLSRLGAPRKWGKKKEKIHVLPMLSGIGRGYSSPADVRVIRA